jgi:amino acid permease
MADLISPGMDRDSQKSAVNSSSDAEKQSQPPQEELHRTLNSRHLQFVAIGTHVLSTWWKPFVDKR